MANKLNKLLNRSTYPPKCNWCGFYGAVKFIKVSPKKEKAACLRCYDIMTWKYEVPEIKVDDLPLFPGYRKLW